ncbi:Chromosome segregation protein Spc [Parasponia andersonii]|uniref:Kinetochore protein SPC25 n=1 Tax=Parasponia andersonii TaxID=3476 RepID=A0A2P5DG20_PARAD|nr:Chromosome segregation protein Spc [Parasponia andersonii]
MDSKAEEPVRTRMESLRMACDTEILAHQQKIDIWTASFRQSLSSIPARVQETVQSQGSMPQAYGFLLICALLGSRIRVLVGVETEDGHRVRVSQKGKLVEVKAKLREAEDDLVKALSAKNRKEAKRIAIMESVAVRKARVEELKRHVQDQRAKRDEYAEILSQQSSVSEETDSQNVKDELQVAISWYNRVLGFHVEGGHGVKFIFKNISLKNPNEEYSFTVRHADNMYTLLDCDPHLNDIKELIYELNRTNGLFTFVRIMRQRFQEAAAQGYLPQSTNLHQESSTVSTSAPASSISTDRNESLAKKNEHHVQLGEVDRRSKKQNRGKGNNDALLSPGSGHRSPRFVV